MPKYMVWTEVKGEKHIEADDPREAAALYHQEVGKMPDNWDGSLRVRDEHGEEWTYRRREAA